MSERAPRGFTLIELLTVIAIIAVLAAILFPVFASVREQVRQGQCMSQMHDLVEKLKLYELDNHSYPPVLLGFAEAPVSYSDANITVNGAEPYVAPGQQGATGGPLSIEQTSYKPLFGSQHLLNSLTDFTCPDEPAPNLTNLVTAVYPPTAGGALANQPVVFTDTWALAMGNDDSSHPVSDPSGQVANDNAISYYEQYLKLNKPNYFAFDSYDTGPQLDANGNPVTGVAELHYCIDWTGQSGPSDPPNQLKYPTLAPQSRTVVTWCTYHAAINHSDKVTVILLDGHAKAVNAKTFVAKGPLNFIP